MNKLFYIMLLIYFFLIFSYINSVSASDFVFKQNQQADIKLSCFNSNNSFCSNSTNCTITINTPTSSNIINNKNMTHNPAYYNYTIPPSNLTSFGEYNGVMQCTDGSDEGYTLFTFEITPNGTKPSTTQGIIYVFVMVLFLILFLLSTIGTFIIDTDHEYDTGGKLIMINYNKHIKFGLFFISYLFLIFTVFFAWQISLNFLYLTWTSTILKVIHTFLWIMLFPVFFGLVILTFVKIFLDARLQELGDRGLKEYGK